MKEFKKLNLLELLNIEIFNSEAAFFDSVSKTLT